MTGMGASDRSWRASLPARAPAHVCHIDLANPLAPIDAPGAQSGYILVAVHGRPIGWITCAVTDGRITSQELRQRILSDLADAALSAIVQGLIARPITPESIDPAALLAPPPTPSSAPLKITVAVCTRDRAAALKSCLEALCALDPAPYEILVVDNAPPNPTTYQTVGAFSTIRYLREDRPGLDWARNCALNEARGEVIAFVDDDVIVDRHWLSYLALGFSDGADAVTGLIAPFELRTPSQLHFEAVGGFQRGFIKAWHRTAARASPPDWYQLGAGRFGAGANMAFRTTILRELGGFDPALDVGTPTEGGGDLEMFFRVLNRGYTLLYEPAALVWHVHRAAPDALRAQLATWGTAMGAFLTSAFLQNPSQRVRVLRFAALWSWIGYCAPVLAALFAPGRVPLKLRFAPLKRLLLGPFRYLSTRVKSRAPRASVAIARGALRTGALREEVRRLNLADGLNDLTDVQDCDRLRLHVHCGQRFVGMLTINNRSRSISACELATAIAQTLGPAIWRIVAPVKASHLAAAQLLSPLLDQSCDEPDFHPRLASIVVATRRRPEMLRRCLASLVAQVTPFEVEIVVVDNTDGDAATRAVVGEYPNLRYVIEPTPGLAPARNSGFRAAGGDILIATDDDIVAPPGWLYELVQPFRFAHVAVATGRVLPLALNAHAQQDFERIGGLDKGGHSFEVGMDWFEQRKWSPPRVWDLGATANAAFRRQALEDPAVSLLPEALGPGTPAGGGEDAYLFYRALKAGYSLYYNSTAVIWHDHRASYQALQRQMFDYSRGHMSYLLTTLITDGDFRSLSRLLLVLPGWHLARLFGAGPRLHKRLVLVACEIGGYILGPLSFIRARLRARASTARGRRFGALEPMPGEAR